MLSENTGDLFRELNKVAHLCQLLTYPADTGRKRAAAGHAVGQLTLWMGQTKMSKRGKKKREIMSFT